MRPRRPVLRRALLAVGFLLAALPAAADELWQTVYRPKLSAIELPVSVLGEGWKASPGLRIDDFEDLSALSGMDRSMATVLAKQMGPLGVTAVGDYSLATITGPNNLVTVRVFVFEDAERCRAWWNLKYQAADWREHYVPVDLPQLVAVDSVGSNKRAVAFGNLWLSAHQLGDGDEHLVALNHLIDALRAPG